MPVISLLLLFVALLSSCATVPATPADSSLQLSTAHDSAARALYLYSRARLAGLEGDYPAALNILRDAIVLDPASAFLHASIAEIKLKIGQSPEALEYISKAIKLDPEYRPPYIMAGTLMAAAGKDLEAAQYLRKAIALDPAKEDAGRIPSKLSLPITSDMCLPRMPVLLKPKNWAYCELENPHTKLRSK